MKLSVEGRPGGGCSGWIQLGDTWTFGEFDTLEEALDKLLPGVILNELAAMRGITISDP